jgi:hypothetical protein
MARTRSRQRRLRGGFLTGLFGSSQNQMGTNYSTSSPSSWNLFGSTPSTGSSYSTSSPSSWNLFGTSPSSMGTGMGSSMGTGMSTGMGTGMGSSMGSMGTGMGSMGTGMGSSMGSMGTGMNTGMGTGMGSPSYQRRFGGRTRTRQMRGGFQDNTSTTDLAVNAAPFSGPTAEPQTMVGGRTRRRGRKGGKKGGKKRSKTYRHRK